MSFEFQINSKYPFLLKNTVLSHGWFQLAPWEWERDNLLLRRTEKLPDNSFVIVEMKQENQYTLNTTIINGNENVSSYHKNIVTRINRWLSLEWNPDEAIDTSKQIDKNIADYIMQGGGRFLRGTTFYEDLLKTICTIYCSWSRTKNMVQSLYNDLGNGSSPTPSEIFSSDENYLTKKLKLGFRSKVMIEITKDLLEKKLINSEGQETNKTTYTNLLSIKGIGPYTASHSMLLLHDFSKIPVDSEVSNYLKTNYNLMPNQIADYFNPWGKYKFFGYKIRRILDQPT
jgi:N-glycosylase/DNA lyase